MESGYIQDWMMIVWCTESVGEHIGFEVSLRLSEKICSIIQG